MTDAFTLISVNRWPNIGGWVKEGLLDHWTTTVRRCRGKLTPIWAKGSTRGTTSVIENIPSRRGNLQNVRGYRRNVASIHMRRKWINNTVTQVLNAWNTGDLGYTININLPAMATGRHHRGKVLRMFVAKEIRINATIQICREVKRVLYNIVSML